MLCTRHKTFFSRRKIPLVKMAVKLLYTKIPNSEKITAAQRTLGKKSNKILATKVITDFLALVLTTYLCSNLLKYLYD